MNEGVCILFKTSEWVIQDIQHWHAESLGFAWVKMHFFLVGTHRGWMSMCTL